MYQIKRGDPFYYSLRSLNVTYFYPSNSDKGYMRRFFTVYSFLRAIGALLWIFCIMHFINALRNKTGVDLSEDISVLTGFVGCAMTCNNFGLRHKRWSRFLTELTNTTKFNKPPSFDKTQKRGNLVSLLYCIYSNIGIVIYALNAFTETGRCKRLNEEKDIGEMCGMFFPVWLPFKGGLKIKVTLNSIQVISTFFNIFPSAIVCMLPWEATELLISKIDHLKLLVLDAFEGTNEEEKRIKFKFCVEYHIAILEIAEELNRLAKITTGHMSLISAIVFGCIATQMVKESSVGAMIHLGGYIIAMFFISEAGQRLMDETMSLTDTIFASKWHEANPKLMKDVQMMLLRSQKPVYIEALPFGEIHYRLFANILKTSYSYLTLISQSL